MTGTQCLIFQTMFLTIRADIDSMGFKFTEIIPVCILNGNRNGDSEVGAETLYTPIHLNLVILSMGECTFQGMIHIHVTANLKVGIRIPVWEC